MEQLPTQATGTEDWAFFVPSSFQSSVNDWLSWDRRGKANPLMGVFSVGDTLYDNQKAYLQWSEALKHFKHCISVKESVGDKVTIAVSRPCDNRLDPVGVFSVYAQELMTILKTGKLPE